MIGMSLTDSGFAQFRAECRNLPDQNISGLNPSRPIWIFGSGQFGRAVGRILIARGFDVAGFIETRPRSDAVLGLPILTWDGLEPSHRLAQLVIGIFNRETPLDQLAALANAAGFHDPIMPWHVYSQLGAELGWRYWLSAPDLILSHLDALEGAWQSLADAESRQCLINICRFRLGMNLGYASFQHATRQYFNELTLPCLAQPPVCYVDGGAYNGDTFAELAGMVDVEAAWLFEPDQENFAALLQTVRSTQVCAHCLPLALAGHYQMLNFCAGKGEAGTIDPKGNVPIAAMALDELLSTQPVHFIKLDVEGAEIAALDGAASVIRRCRPVLAISLYHRPQDIWEIPQRLAALCPDYRFYLRQHFFNSFDSVLYALPNPLLVTAS